MADRDQVEGDVKEGAGRLTDDESLEGEGRAQGALGDVKEGAGDAWDESKDKAGDLQDEADERI